MFVDGSFSITLHFENKVGGQNQIFISDEICNEIEFESFIADYYRWCDKLEVHGNNRITLVHVENFESITQTYYSDFYNAKNIVSDEVLCLYGNHKYSTSLNRNLEELGKNN